MSDGDSTGTQPDTISISSESTLSFRLPSPGQMIGKYRLETCLGEGGMGVVYKAMDTELNRYVAIKFIHTPSPGAVERLRREASLQAKVEHPAICPIYAIDEYKGIPYIVMRYIQGGSLREAYDRMNLQEKIEIMVRIAEAIHEAHRRGLIHRDLKPSNVLIEIDDNGVHHPFITDFGLARELETEGVTQTGMVMGTPQYMPPEQAYGEIQNLDRRTDVYALGATLYELVCGRPPFIGDSSLEVLMKVVEESPPRPRKVFPQLPVDLDIIIMKCLEKDPNDRYPSARALAEDLRRFLNDEPIQARRTPLWRRTRMWMRRNRTLALVFAGSMVLSIGLLGWGGYQWWTGRERARLAQIFGQKSRDLEAVLRFEKLMPAHDIRPAVGEIQKELEILKEQIRSLPEPVRAPGDYAIGRAFLVLGHVDASAEYLERAIRSGYEAPEVFYTMGRILSEQYVQAVLEAERIRDDRLKKEHLQQAEKEFRHPAIRFLLRGREQTLEPADYSLALLAFNRGNYRDVVRRLEPLRRTKPWFYEAALLEAMAYHQIGNRQFERGQFDDARVTFGKAEKILKHAKSIASSDDEVFYRLCELYYSMIRMASLDKGQGLDKMVERALKVCTEGININPDRRDLYVTRGVVYLRWAYGNFNKEPIVLSSLAKGEQDFKKAQQLGEDNDYEVLDGLGNIHLLRGMMAMRKGEDAMPELDQAGKYLDKAIAVYPQIDRLYNNRGNVALMKADLLADKGQFPRDAYQRAREFYEKALSLNPDNFYAMSNLGIVYHRLAWDNFQSGKDPQPEMKKSIETYKKASKINPGDLLIVNNIGFSLLSLAKIEMFGGRDPLPSLHEAEDYLSRVLKEAEWYETLLNMAEIYRIRAILTHPLSEEVLKNLSSAFQYVNKGVAIDPGELRSYEIRIQIYFHQEAYERIMGRSGHEALKNAEEVLRKAYGIIPDNSNLKYFENELTIRRLLARGEPIGSPAYEAVLDELTEILNASPQHISSRILRLSLWLAWYQRDPSASCSRRDDFQDDRNYLAMLAPYHEVADALVRVSEQVNCELPVEGLIPHKLDRSWAVLTYPIPYRLGLLDS